jgi:hypothetical protein
LHVLSQHQVIVSYSVHDHDVCCSAAAAAAAPVVPPATQFDPTGPPGITLHTSNDAGMSFNSACLPVALRVSQRGCLAAADATHEAQQTCKLCLAPLCLASQDIQISSFHST